MSSQTICCGCNIYKMAKIITGIEITLCFILSIPFLSKALVGITFHTDALHYWITDPWDREGILIAFIIIVLILTLIIMLYLIFRTWIQFRVFYADSDNLTLNNTIELQLLRPV